MLLLFFRNSSSVVLGASGDVPVAFIITKILHGSRGWSVSAHLGTLWRSVFLAGLGLLALCAGSSVGGSVNSLNYYCGGLELSSSCSVALGDCAESCFCECAIGRRTAGVQRKRIEISRYQGV